MKNTYYNLMNNAYSRNAFEAKYYISIDTTEINTFAAIGYKLNEDGDKISDLTIVKAAGHSEKEIRENMEDWFEFAIVLHGQDIEKMPKDFDSDEFDAWIAFKAPMFGRKATLAKFICENLNTIEEATKASSTENKEENTMKTSTWTTYIMIGTWDNDPEHKMVATPVSARGYGDAVQIAEDNDFSPEYIMDRKRFEDLASMDYSKILDCFFVGAWYEYNYIKVADFFIGNVAKIAEMFDKQDETTEEFNAMEELDTIEAKPIKVDYTETDTMEISCTKCNAGDICLICKAINAEQTLSKVRAQRDYQSDSTGPITITFKPIELEAITREAEKLAAYYSTGKRWKGLLDALKAARIRMWDIPEDDGLIGMLLETA